MADILTDTMTYIQSGKVAGIPVIYFFILIVLIIFVVYLLLTRKPKQNEYKSIDMKKEIKKDLDSQYKFFASPVGKPIYSSLTRIGYAMGYMPMVWNKRLKRYENTIISNKQDYAQLEVVAKEVYQKSFKDLDDAQKKGVRSVVREEQEQNEPAEIIDEGKEKTTIKFGKRETLFDETIPVFCFRVCSDNFLSKTLFRISGIGSTFFIIDESMVTITDASIQFASGLQRQIYFGNFVFSSTGKKIIENTSFRINRQAEIQEIGNDVSRTVFWDNEFRKRAMLAREVSDIEAKKFKSQQESAQD